MVTAYGGPPGPSAILGRHFAAFGLGLADRNREGDGVAVIAADEAHFRRALASLDTTVQGVLDLRDRLLGYPTDERRPEDVFAWATCVLALQAVSRGNSGIGCLLVDRDGAVLESGHDEVLHPRFRSDQHAEMVVMTRFEDRQSRPFDLLECRLYTSMEPCPMCLCRLIVAGVGRVLYVAADGLCGMVRRRRSLPPVWRELVRHQEFRQARCSPGIRQAVRDIFLANVQYPVRQAFAGQSAAQTSGPTGSCQ